MRRPSQATIGLLIGFLLMGPAICFWVLFAGHYLIHHTSMWMCN